MRKMKTIGDAKTVKKMTGDAKPVKKMSAFELIINAVRESEDFGIIDAKNGPGCQYVKELAKRFSLSEIQALLMAVFVDKCDDHRINYKDIAQHFDVRPLIVMTIIKEIDSLVQKDIIMRRKDSDGNVTYRVPNKTIECLLNEKLPEPERIDNLSAREFFDMVDAILERRNNDEVTDDELHTYLNTLIQSNQQLHVAQMLKSFKLDEEDLVLYLVMCMCFINDHDDRIGRCDIDDYFDRGTFRRHANALEAGNHVLMHGKLVEHACVDGKVESSSWKLTNYSKEDVLTELDLSTKCDMRANLTRHEEITPKTLFYNNNVTKNVNELEKLLSDDRMKRVMERLKDNGMRQGFTCLFYGGPGTGKTETVLQLARQTGRDIMLVDVPSIRSKWVGETEKNVKEVFDRYRKMVKNNDVAPILLFNEADAILNKRAEGATNSVDKMENAMQNIILQEMENLEGIMIATTNLTGSLDAAFERRFLYKIEFEKPTPNERKHIWKAMLPSLSDKEALSLAESYDFSGGQIENVARKQLINSILADQDSVSIDAIVVACKTEQLGKKNNRVKVGF